MACLPARHHSRARRLSRHRLQVRADCGLIRSVYEQVGSGSELINCVWRASGDADGEYVDAASEYWGLGFTLSSDGALSASLIGPSLTPREIHYVRDDRHWGVELAAHVFVRNVAKRNLLGVMIDLPTDGGWFELAGSRYRIPEFAALEALVEQLRSQGTLASNPAIAYEMTGGDAGFSERSRQRQYRDATGLGRKQIEQLRRVRHAFALMQDGAALPAAATAAGYADQAHMTRAFRALAGQSPARILADYLADQRTDSSLTRAETSGGNLQEEHPSGRAE